MHHVSCYRLGQFPNDVLLMPEIITAVLFANGLTLTFIYAIFRLRKDESDMKAIGLFLFAALVAGIMACLLQKSPDGRTSRTRSSRSP